MTELDFDELDKAVTNIMSGVDTSKRKEGFDDPIDTVVEIPSSIDNPAEQPSQPVADATLQATTLPEPAGAVVPSETKTSEPLAVKRRGQFMDVMHPSSDMKTMVAPRREGVVVQPTGPIVSERPETVVEAPFSDASSTENSSADLMPSFDTEPATGGAVEQATPPEDKPQQAWPDPIDAAESSVVQPVVDTNVSSDVDPDAEQDTELDSLVDSVLTDISSVPDDVVKEIAEPSVEQPISSPFIADAKVEKRPLGTSSASPEPVVEADTPQLDPVPPPAEPLPAELDTDVMAVETSNTSAGETSTDMPVETASQPGASKPTIPGSIPQQYAEQPSTSDASNSAIYDTSTHHQPLEGGAKKSSPMKWVILSLVLLIVGALGGAAYFYFKTQL